MRSMILGAALTSLIACSEGVFPPELCSPLEDREIFIGEEQDIAVCFTDPDGGVITISATSSDPSVVRASGNSNVIMLEGVGVGEAVITVTATDSDSDISTESLMVSVPNRAPEVGTIPDLRLLDNDVLEVNLARIFSDPDGHVLTYSAVSLNEIVIVSVIDSIATVTLVDGVGLGSLEVTASDRFGLAVTTRIPVTVLARTMLFRDEFDELSNRWAPDDDTDTRIEDGRLRINVNKIGHIGWMPRRAVTDNWRVTLSIENNTTDMWGGFFVRSEDPSVKGVAFLFGVDASVGFITSRTVKSNFAFLVLDRETGAFRMREDWYGDFAEITDPFEVHEMTVLAGNGAYTISINDVIVKRISIDDIYPTTPMDMDQIIMISWPAEDKPINPQGGSWIDWIEVSGVTHRS